MRMFRSPLFWLIMLVTVVAGSSLGCWSQLWCPSHVVTVAEVSPPVRQPIRIQLPPQLVEPVVQWEAPKPKPKRGQPLLARSSSTLAETVQRNQRVQTVKGYHHRQIVISLDEQRLYALEDGRVAMTFICSTSSTGIILFGADPWDEKPHDHVGTFKILEKRGAKQYVKWCNDWMYWPMRYVFGHFIHGTDHEDMLGQPASHGCVRLSKVNAAELYQWANIGDEIKVQKEAYLEAP